MVQSFNPAGIRSALTLLRRPYLLVPHMAVSDIRAIPFDQLHQHGIKYMVFDKDNCLTAPYADHIHADFQAAWSLCKQTFSPQNLLIVSNSAGTPDDINNKAAMDVERALGVQVLRHRDKKPACGNEILAHLGTEDPGQVAVVGDRLATDVVLANLNSMYSIWTRHIVTAKGDNAVAAVLRRAEHCIYDELKKRGTQPPAHFLDKHFLK
ncbi:hypothetical protein J3B02_000124 [Coemansia erecta]|uniref:Mitochondrial PGP phosphatase n=1 Tax=Coemansia asiatica TaxID=1052880 RepID=A0A9W7XSE0_9FUNG|nr:hypothetical protein LPJ64_000227 [Coemansia asiatica]KAJ2858534.1 hypothetical protein J3B02_000124 [Coemansia erecta]KAJ2889204.1 hypothetical protein FB639_000073 [Coemansia asiatica]